MGGSEIRIFAPNMIVNCVDSRAGGSFTGRLYHSYSDKPKHYSDINGMLLAMDNFYDHIQFPMASTESRTFRKTYGKSDRKEKVRLMQDKQICKQNGRQATFIIQVQYRQNATWQGKIIWTEENKAHHFRSALELIKLMDSVLGAEDEKQHKAEHISDADSSAKEHIKIG